MLETVFDQKRGVARLIIKNSPKINKLKETQKHESKTNKQKETRKIKTR